MPSLKPKTIFQRWRYWAFLPLPLLVIVITAFLSPEGWRSPMVKVAAIAWSAVALALTHSARTALLDYVKLSEVYRKAMESADGAGRVFMGVCILMGLLFLGLSGFAHSQEVHPRMQQLAPVFVSEMERYHPTMPRRSYLGTLAYKESCISATHSKCLTTQARLKTAREEGAGLFQLTRAWRADGTLRFDALAETRAMAPEALQDLSWQNIYLRAELGTRAALVKLRECHQRMPAAMDDLNRLAMCDAEYNGGRGGLAQDRQLCKLTKGCDPNQWFGHVELHSNKSREKWQGYGQSAFDINRAHVRGTVPLAARWRYMPALGV